ncbi:Myosin head, motor domain [Dillenia turbinata]|uniref:Myosin head, motor domain n=1 Tax=Dillenia turbinata TaxID=194707 RepID=A0AAN8ZVJ5_9MAGN
MLSSTMSLPSGRSSLEEMLDSLRRRDEKPKDAPPALPPRPVSKAARLPSARRSLPSSFKIPDSSPATENSNFSEEDKKRSRLRNRNFGAKKTRREKTVETPYEVSSSSRPESEWCENIDYFMKKRLSVWCPVPGALWKSGKIQLISGEEASIKLSDGTVIEASTEELLPANPYSFEDIHDLMRLSYLNEPSVLHNLECRFCHDMVYSKAGPLLIAINPFKDVHLYGDEVITAYRQKLTNEPHVYATADNAYNQMMRDGENQSIIISGESGAGKTEAARLAVEYLVALCDDCSGLKEKILKASHILEAFGNAKTSINDNSSRFGRFTEILFSTKGKLRGAKIQTYLPEKMRVVKRAKGERSYHIFYQLCAGAPLSLKDRLNLKMANQYQYLNQSECLEIRSVDDASKFHMLMEAMDIVQISKEDQGHIFDLLAAVLWLGNISFNEVDTESCIEVALDEALAAAARMIGCSTQELISVLSSPKDGTSEKLTLQEAISIRDGLARSIYASLFDWLLELINKSLEVDKQETGRSISILDICGFESFQKNSFEQLCINYGSERLQQHFARHLLTIEQEAYDMDGLDWIKVDYEDNHECLNLFERKSLGLFSLLDEESYLPAATDSTFLNKLKQHLIGNPCFKEDRNGFFKIRHFTGEVLYDSSGFLDKNRDTLHANFSQLLSSSCLLSRFAPSVLNQSQVPTSFASELQAPDSQKQLVGSKYKDQLFNLMQQLEHTKPHFILCIRPNSEQLPSIYRKELVLQQLRYSGVLEIVAIARVSYPTQMAHEEFARRYVSLLLEKNVPQDPLDISVAVLRHCNVLPEMYQVGYKKLYMRAGLIDMLEAMKKLVPHGTPEVKKCFHYANAYRPFRELKNGVTALQSFIRGENDRRKYNNLVERHRNGVLAQKQAKQQSSFTHSRSAGKRISMKDLPQENGHALPSALDELQWRVLQAEAALGQKEEENAALLDQLHQSETRWSEYEAKMKAMEEMWQKQMATLQTSLAAAKRSLGADNTGRPGGIDNSPSPHFYDSDDTRGGNTPMKFSNLTPDVGLGWEENGGLNAVNHLLKEFEQQRQVFEEDAKALVEVKSGHALSAHPDNELRKLKSKFEAWKKEYKVRLRETKAMLHKLPHSEAEKGRRKWWGKLSSKLP